MKAIRRFATCVTIPSESILTRYCNGIPNHFSYGRANKKKYPYIALRAKYHIKAKRIAPASNQFRKHSAYDKGECAETILVPPTLFNPGVEVNIYNNKVAFLNYAEDMGVIIESVSIAEVMREAYRLSWLGAKQVAVNREEVVTA